MKKLILIYLIVIGCISLANAESDSKTFLHKPAVTLAIPGQQPTTVYVGETLRIPMYMHYDYLRKHKQWSFSVNDSVWLEYVAGKCPKISYDDTSIGSGDCRLNIVVEGKEVGRTIRAQAIYHVWSYREDFNRLFYSSEFVVTVIPHSLSMTANQEQKATAGVQFNYPLRNAVMYYDENVQAYGPVNLEMSEKDKAELNKLGLFFDPASFSIKGTPNKLGLHTFKIAATNAHSSAKATELKINVSENLEHKPQFIENPDIPPATPSKKYSLNLMNLLKQKNIFANTNQVTFSISRNYPKARWIDINPQNPTVLEGEPPANLAGTISQVTVVACSNTGGESKPLTINIPIAMNPDLKPVIKPFEMEHLAGRQFYTDISNHIEDPTNDSNLKVIIDKVELENSLPTGKTIPEIPSFHFSSNSPTVLEGVIPSDAVGYKYLITLRAINSAGGTSDATVIPLKVSINKEKTPQIHGDHPHFPILSPGQDFYYDFVTNRDVIPEYEDAPYEIQFAEGSKHPNWLKLENNKLTASADEIPDDLDSDVEIELIIKNIPGGMSEKISVDIVTATK